MRELFDAMPLAILISCTEPLFSRHCECLFHLRMSRAKSGIDQNVRCHWYIHRNSTLSRKIQLPTSGRAIRACSDLGV